MQGRTVVGDVHAVEAQQDGSGRHLLADRCGGVSAPNAHALLAGLHFTPPSLEQPGSRTGSMGSCCACMVMRLCTSVHLCGIPMARQSLPVRAAGIVASFQGERRGGGGGVEGARCMGPDSVRAQMRGSAWCSSKSVGSAGQGCWLHHVHAHAHPAVVGASACQACLCSAPHRRVPAVQKDGVLKGAWAHSKTPV